MINLDTHSFSITLAVKYGIPASALITSIVYWLDLNKKKGVNIYDGRVWTYNSAKAWSKLFPYWSEDQIDRLFKKLVDKGIVKKYNYNKLKSDRTLWYTIIDKDIYDSTCCDSNHKNQSPETEKMTPKNRGTVPRNRGVSSRETAEALPVLTSSITTDLKTPLYSPTTEKPKNDPSSQPKPDSTVVERTRFQDFWDQYGRKVGRAKAEAYWTRNKLDKMADTILENIGARKAAGMHADPQFVPHPIRYLRDKMWDDEVTKIKSNGTAKLNNPPERRLTEDEIWEMDIKNFLEKPINYISKHPDCGKVENHELLWRFMRSSNHHSPKSVTKLNGKLFGKEQAKELANGLSS